MLYNLVTYLGRIVYIYILLGGNSAIFYLIKFLYFIYTDLKRWIERSLEYLFTFSRNFIATRFPPIMSI